MGPVRRRHRRNYNEPGHAHELTFSCYRNQAFLKADRTRRWLAESIDLARTKHDFDVWAFVFMLEHVHLIVRPRRAEYDIADIRKAVKGPVGRKAIGYLREHAPDRLPRITRQRGNRTECLFWQSGGGYDRNIDQPGTLFEMIDYIHLNPVRRGFVARAAKWYWSSAAHYQGGESPLDIDPIPVEWLEAE